MSVIAWDGKTLCADRQMTNNDLRCRCSKMHIQDTTTGRVALAWTGENEQGLLLADWYAKGADRDKWPKFQEDKQDWTRLVVADKHGCSFYERLPVAQPVLDDFAAWGSGRDFALGAMGMGATAEQAVEVAIRFSTGCGFGVDICFLR